MSALVSARVSALVCVWMLLVCARVRSCCSHGNAALSWCVRLAHPCELSRSHPPVCRRLRAVCHDESSSSLDDYVSKQCWSFIQTAKAGYKSNRGTRPRQMAVQMRHICVPMKTLLACVSPLLIVSALSHMFCRRVRSCLQVHVPRFIQCICVYIYVLSAPLSVARLCSVHRCRYV